MTENLTELPDPATFDLAEFVADKVTYARYKVTVYLAAEEVRRSVALAEEASKLREERTRLLVDIKQSGTTQTSLGEIDPDKTRVAQIDGRLAEIAKERNGLQEAISASALTFFFSVTGRDAQARIAKNLKELLASENGEEEEAEESAEQKMARRLGRDPEVLMRQTALMMRELVVEVRNASGATYPIEKLTEESLIKILNVLHINEIARINDAMALTMNGALDYERALDAGFPG